MAPNFSDLPRRDFLRSLALVSGGGISGSGLLSGCRNDRKEEIENPSSLISLLSDEPSQIQGIVETESDLPPASTAKGTRWLVLKVRDGDKAIPFKSDGSSWTALSNTMHVYNGPDALIASDFGTGTEAIQLAIDKAADHNRGVVVVPEPMLPYDAARVRFVPSVRMVREGGPTSVIDVGAYGAAGDGKTDDSSAFAAARDAARKNKNALYVPSTPHSYRHRGTLLLDWAECVIYGDGPNSSKIDFEGTGVGLHVDGSENDHMLGAYVHDLYLSGDGMNTTNTLKINDVDKKAATIRNLSVEDATQANVLMEQCWTMEVQNLYAGGHNNGTYGLRVINANNFKFRSIYVLNIASDGIGIEMTNLDGVHGSGLICEQMDVGLRLTSSATGGIHLNGLYFETSSPHTMSKGIVIGTDSDPPVRNIDISGAHFAIGKNTLIDLNEVDGCKLSGIASNGPGTINVHANARNCGIENFDREGVTFTGSGRIRDLEASSLFISSREFYAVGGESEPTTIGSPPDTARGYALSSEGDGEIATQFRLPDEWRSPGQVEIRLIWTSEARSGGTFSVSAAPAVLEEGDDIRQSRLRSTIIADSDPPGAVSVDTSSRWQERFSQGNVCNLHIRRNGSAEQDTLDVPLIVLGVEVVKTTANR